MTPETYAAREVALFEAIEFPDRWEKVRTLVSGEDFADSMMFKYNGYYWLFTAVHGDDLRIYYSKDLKSRFKSHPINGKNIKGRNAGGVYIQNGHLIRPVMDCMGCYGRAVILKEIVELTPEVFEERNIHYIEPIWAFGLDGTHTYNQNEDFIVYDGRRTILKEDI